MTQIIWIYFRKWYLNKYLECRLTGSSWTTWPIKWWIWAKHNALKRNRQQAIKNQHHDKWLSLPNSGHHLNSRVEADFSLVISWSKRDEHRLKHSNVLFNLMLSPHPCGQLICTWIHVLLETKPKRLYISTYQTNLYCKLLYSSIYRKKGIG